MGRTRRPPPDEPDPVRPGVRRTDVAVRDFTARHPEWVAALPGEGPHYAIPAAALRGPELERVFGADLAIEREFTHVCDEHGIIGVWGRHLIGCHLLTRQPVRLDDPLIAALGWDARQLAMIRTAAGRADTAHDRLQGVVGWLLTEPQFLTDVATLRAEYEVLPVADRPNFPLGRVVSVDVPEGDPPAFPTTMSAFAGILRGFLDRWGLASLSTWDLPDPQGPLLPNPLPDGPARPAHGVHVFVPVHYPLQGDDGLLGRVREFQRQQARDLGVPAGFGGVAHHAQYAQMFRLIHLDRAVRGRFADRPPRGIVSAVEAAAVGYLGIGAESVHRLRTWIRACRAGRRQTIPQLRD